MGVKAMGEERFLDRIVGATRRRVAEKKEQVSLGALREEVAKASPPRRFAEALRPATLGPARLIAEVKRASPSKGQLAEVLDPADQARAYAEGGAAAVSVLTEPQLFLGSLDDLAAVRSAVDVPILCKDFFLDEYQVYEARAAGADAILLICAMLDDRLLAQLFHLAARLGMDSLIETHSGEEIEQALRLEAEAPIIGINCRDLQTFTVDTGLVARLGHLVPRTGILVAESGIADRVQAAQARARGADAILVGEALMRSTAVTQTTCALATAPGGAFAGWFGRSERPFVKLCGITELQHAELASELGADAIGLVFAPSHRQVSPEQARLVARAVTGPLVVGVFVNASAGAIASIAADVGLGAIQLSGDEPPEFAAEVAKMSSLPVIKGLRLPSGSPEEALDEYALAGAALLLDTPSTDGRFGGTGQVGDWAQASRMARRWPIIVSGGLTPGNVAAALVSIRPAGVDVSSGIETNRAKDSAKMKEFLFQSREASIA